MGTVDAELPKYQVAGDAFGSAFGNAMVDSMNDQGQQTDRLATAQARVALNGYLTQEQRDLGSLSSFDLSSGGSIDGASGDSVFGSGSDWSWNPQSHQSMVMGGVRIPAQILAGGSDWSSGGNGQGPTSTVTYGVDENGQRTITVTGHQPRNATTNASIMGITEAQMDADIAAGHTSAWDAASYAGRTTLYAAWNFATAGFVGRHDQRLTDNANGRLSDSNFWKATAIDGFTSVASIVVAGRVGGMVSGRVGSGYFGYAATGGAAGAAFDLTQQAGRNAEYYATGGQTGRSGISLNELSSATIGGAALGLGGKYLSEYGNYNVQWNVPEPGTLYSNPMPFKLVAPTSYTSPISDNAFVRFDPSEFDSSIDATGVQKRFFADGKVWLTKYGDIKNVTNPADLETMLYRKNLWPSVEGKFDRGGTLRVIDNVTDAIPSGLTNKTNGVRQWHLLRDIPPEDMTTILKLDGKL